jgi:hypothetical protein
MNSQVWMKRQPDNEHTPALIQNNKALQSSLLKNSKGFPIDNLHRLVFTPALKKYAWANSTYASRTGTLINSLE